MKTIFMIMFFMAFTLSAAEEALFSVTTTEGDTIFAVYPSGIKVLNEEGNNVMIANRDSIRMYFDEPATGRASRGGFAVGGVASRNLVKEYFTVEPESTRIYFKESDLPIDASRGGFAVGGVASRERTISQYLSIKPDKTDINVKDPLDGFSISNLQNQEQQKIMNISQMNSFIGFESGMNTLEEGNYNSFIGYQSGYSNTEGSRNVFLGYKSGFNNMIGENNIFIGNHAGYTNNGVVGNPATGNFNIFIGNLAGFSNQDGYSNVFIGEAAGNNNISGKHNVYIGKNSGRHDQSGEYNTLIGAESGNYSLGSHNVFIGYQAGYGVQDNNKLIIQNSNQDAPLISGDFAEDTVEISDVLKLTPSSMPNNPTAGMIFFDETDNKLKAYDGDVWHDLW